MRSFIVLCLVAVASAEKLGYNYQPVGHSNSGLSVAPGGGSYGAASNSGSPSYAQQGSSGSPSYAPQAELEKEFYTFTADDADFNDPAASNQVANAAKQGLRVIFIRGPEGNGLEDAALALAKQAGEQHTQIYVLHKQTDLSGLADKLNQAGNNNNAKPEVHFVKYRTPEDAANAQRAIQGQYDSLGGKSHNYNGGVAPVLNFASKAPVGAGPSVSGPGASYLPASIFRQ